MTNDIPRKPLLLTSREAAEALGVSPRKLWAMTFEDSPGVPFVRLGRLVRYPVGQLHEWIEQRVKGGSGDDVQA